MSRLYKVWALALQLLHSLGNRTGSCYPRLIRWVMSLVGPTWINTLSILQPFILKSPRDISRGLPIALTFQEQIGRDGHSSWRCFASSKVVRFDSFRRFTTYGRMQVYTNGRHCFVMSCWPTSDNFHKASIHVHIYFYMFIVILLFVFSLISPFSYVMCVLQSSSFISCSLGASCKQRWSHFSTWTTSTLDTGDESTSCAPMPKAAVKATLDLNDVGSSWRSPSPTCQAE